MGPNAHRPLGGAHDFGHLGKGKLLKPMELNHFPLVRRKLLEGLAKRPLSIVHLHGKGLFMVRRCQVGRIDSGLPPPFGAPKMLPDEVHGNRKDPWFKLATQVEVEPRVMRLEHGLLGDLTGHLLRAKGPNRKSHENGKVPLKQHAKGRVVTVHIRPEKFLVGRSVHGGIGWFSNGVRHAREG